jgi:hypothetical protein
MSRGRLVAMLVAALLTLSAALFFATQRNRTPDSHGGALLPALAHELNTVTSLSVLKGSATPTVTIHKQGERWTVAQRGDYPADVAKLRKLLLALSDATIREQKTSNPANYSLIGVEDPTVAGASGAQLNLLAQDGAHGLIVGKTVAEGSFVRRAGEATSYIVEQGISFDAEPRYWIDSKLIDVPTAQIQSITVKPAAAPGYSVHRIAAANSAAANSAAANSTAGTSGPANEGFALDAIPAGRTAADPQLLAPSPTAFSSLSVDDVAAAADIDFSMPSIATLTLSDGNVLTFTGATIGDKRWIQVAASKDAALSAKTAGRAFQIAAYRYDAIFRPLEQLLVPKPTANASANASAKAPARPMAPVAAPKKLAPAPTPW